MKPHYFLSLLFLIGFQATSGQKSIDTLYLDINKSVVTGANYVYYRVLTQDSTGLYTFNDFTRTGRLDLTGNLGSLNPITVRDSPGPGSHRGEIKALFTRGGAFIHSRRS
jgi:hypothetical protein